MGKKTSKRPKTREKVSGEKAKEPDKGTPVSDKGDKPDFGGWPDIDFKKNLGCG